MEATNWSPEATAAVEAANIRFIQDDNTVDPITTLMLKDAFAQGFDAAKKQNPGA